MNQVTTVEEKLLSRVANTILEAWHDAHGMDTGHASAMLGEEGVVIFVYDALCKAEQMLAGEREGRATLEEYVKALLQHVCEQERDRVAAYAGRPVVETSVSVDSSAGWVMCLFRFST